MAISKKMETDSFDRIEASGKSAIASAETETTGGNVNSWEQMISDGCSEPYTNTAKSLKSRNGRGGTQAGA